MSLGEINYRQLVSIGKIIFKCSQCAFAMIAIISNKINEGGGFEIFLPPNWALLKFSLFFNEIQIDTSVVTKLRKPQRTNKSVKLISKAYCNSLLGTVF